MNMSPVSAVEEAWKKSFPERRYLDSVFEISTPEGCRHPDLIWRPLENPAGNPSIDRRNARFAGKVVGGRKPVKTGRRYVRVHGKDYRVLDLAWILLHATEPTLGMLVEAIDGDDHNLNPQNLALVRDSQRRSDAANRKSWTVRTSQNGRLVSFEGDTLDDAYEAAATALNLPMTVVASKDGTRNARPVRDTPALRKAVSAEINRSLERLITKAIRDALPGLIELAIIRGIHGAGYATAGSSSRPWDNAADDGGSIEGTPALAPAQADGDRPESRRSSSRMDQTIDPSTMLALSGRKVVSVEDAAAQEERDGLRPKPETRATYKGRVKLLPELEHLPPDALIDGPTGKPLVDHQGQPFEMTVAEFSALPWAEKGKKFVRFDGAGRPRLWIDRYRNLYSMPRGKIFSLAGREVTREYEDLPSVALNRTDAEDRYLRLGYPKEYAAAASDHEFPDSPDKTPDTVRQTVGFAPEQAHFTDPFTVVEMRGTNSQVNPMTISRSAAKRQEYLKRLEVSSAKPSFYPPDPIPWGIVDPEDPERLLPETLEDGTLVYPSGNTRKTLLVGKVEEARYRDWEGPAEEGDTDQDRYFRKKATEWVEKRKRKEEWVYYRDQNGKVSDSPMLPEELEELLARQRVIDERMQTQLNYFRELRKYYYACNEDIQLEAAHEGRGTYDWYAVRIPPGWWNEICGLRSAYSRFPKDGEGWRVVWAQWGPRTLDAETQAVTRTRQELIDWAVAGNSPIFKDLPEGWEPSEECLAYRVYGYHSETLENPEQMREIGWGDFTGPDNPPPPGTYWLPRGVKQEIDNLLRKQGLQLDDRLYKPMAYAGNLKQLEDELRTLAAGGWTTWHDEMGFKKDDDEYWGDDDGEYEEVEGVDYEIVDPNEVREGPDPFELINLEKSDD